jgi:hypothetical protein
MKHKTAEVDHDMNFKTLFKGKYYGVLRWHQLDELWIKIKNDDEGWYCYEIGKSPPTEMKRGNALKQIIDGIDSNLREKHDEDYCGIVYVDNLEKPRFIKVFDPKNIGTSCSIGTKAPLPEWIMSKVRPEDLSVNEEANKYKKRWLGNLFSKKS